MFIILLKFSHNKSQASQFMASHNDWIQQGLDDGVFILVGTLQPASGGAIIATETNLEALQQRINADPFVAENIVTPEILEIAPNKTNKQLSFLLGENT